MKKLTFAVAIAMLGTSGTAYAQNSATQSTTATTRIIQAISIAKNSDLSFGRIVKPSSDSSVVTVTSGGARSVTSGGAALAGGTVTAATYTVTGEGGQTFSITPDASVTLNNGAATLTAATSASAATGTLSGALGSQGTTTFGVGAALTIPSTAASGDYTGTFNVVVAYN